MKLHKKFLTPIFSLMIFLVILSLLMTSGCSSKKKHYSGFLHDYSRLQPETKDNQSTMYWQDPSISLKTYKKFMIEPVSFYISPEHEKEAGKINPDLLNGVLAYSWKALVNELETEYTLVDEAGPDVARLRVALTSIDVNRKDLKIYQYIPVALVLTGVGEVTGKRDSIAVINMEAELLDSLTGRRVAAVVKTRGNEVDIKKVEDLATKHIYPTIDFWVKKFKDRLMNAK